MAQPDVIYLELLEAGDSSHKFYEVTVEEQTVTIRYGRIGEAGATQTATFDTPELAKAHAQKKTKEKQARVTNRRYGECGRNAPLLVERLTRLLRPLREAEPPQNPHPPHLPLPSSGSLIQVPPRSVFM